MSTIQSPIKQEEGYAIRVTNVPGTPVVTKVIIWNDELDSVKLGELITDIDARYQPLQVEIVNKRK